MQAHAGCPKGRDARAKVQARPNGTMRQPPVPGRCQARPPDGPSGLSSFARLSRNGAIAVETVGAAVERAPRIVPHLGRQRGDVAARDVGRIADHEIEGAGKRRAEIAGGELRARGKAEAAGVVARGRERLAADVGADAGRVRQFGEAARAAARPSRCRDRRCAARGCAGRRCRSRQAPPRPRFRFPAAAPAWLVEPQRQAPEFLDAEDARDRLAVEPPRGKRSQRVARHRRRGCGRFRSSARCDRGRARGRRAAARRARANPGRPGETRRPARGAPARRSCPRASSACAAIRCLRPPAIRPDAR